MKLKSCIVGVLVAAASTTLFTAGASAQAFGSGKSTAAEADARAPAVETVSDFQASAQCPNTPVGSCIISFPKIKERKRLVIKHASCFMETNAAGSEINGLGLGIAAGTIFSFMNPVSNRTGQTPSFSAETDTSFIVKAGETPQVLAFASGGDFTNMLCSIFGQMTTQK